MSATRSLRGGRVRRPPRSMTCGRALGAVVYKRRSHVINLFVAQGANTEHRAKTETVQGFNIRRWSERGLNYWAVSDLSADELTEFGEKFEAAMRTSGTG